MTTSTTLWIGRRCPGLSPIENVWGIMARRIYTRNKQYSSVEELGAAVEACWQNIADAEFERLAESLPERIVKVLRANGDVIDF